jgi:hypothetical protein
VSVATPDGCGWATSGAPAWVTIDAGFAGTGAGTVQYSVAPNAGTGRGASLSIGGQGFGISQAAAGCTFSLASGGQSIGAGGGTASVALTASAGCAWTAASDVPWMAVVAGASGTGDGTVYLEVAANPSSVARSGTIAVAGQTYAVAQAGAPCGYDVVPLSASFGPAGGSGSAAVTAPEGCDWTAAAVTTWASITAGTPGSGNGTVQFTVAANDAITSRSTILTIAGKTFSVTQGGALCTYALSASSASASGAGAAGSLTVTAPPGCPWTASSDATWLGVTAGVAGSGGGVVQWSAGANDTTAPRSATLAIAGLVYTVSQAGATCAYVLTPTSASFSSSSTSASVAVSAPSGCAWTSTSPASDTWIAITAGASGNGNGQVFYALASNAGSASRSSTLTVAGASFAVTQAGAGCTFGLAATSANAPAAGTSGSVAVTASGAGCGWSAASDVPWITVTSGAGGSGSGSVGYAVAANPTTAARSGTVHIAGNVFTVNQAAAPCAYALSPSSASFSAAAADGLVGVTTTPECAWTATASAAWIVIGTGASGTGSGTVGVSVAANGGSAARSGTVTVRGNPASGPDLVFTVTQSYGADSVIVIQ